MGSCDTSGLDITQVKLLEEECILVNEQDQVQGSATKKTCHQLDNINKGMRMYIWYKNYPSICVCFKHHECYF